MNLPPLLSTRPDAGCKSQPARKRRFKYKMGVACFRLVILNFTLISHQPDLRSSTLARKVAHMRNANRRHRRV